MTRETTTAAMKRRPGGARRCFDIASEILKLLIRLLARIFGWPIRAMSYLTGGGSRSGRGGTHSADQERAQRRAEMEHPQPTPGDVPKSSTPERLVPIMKEYLRTTDSSRRACLARRLAEANVLPYLDRLTDDERSAFLLTPSSSLRKHFSGQLYSRTLPAWDPHEQVLVEEKLPDPARETIPVGTAVPQPRKRARFHDVGFEEILRHRTAQLMRRQRMTSEPGRGKHPDM
ncbi:MULTISPECIES: hypothetical protein [Limimaricola]|uniref:Uncharacterized protein n=1 Tax=Limimaricola litoreus TaxID=2955316 RepID=A0A9X2FME6_9RHOB|nr:MULTISPECIES: hypothetical protein [Limimaricola]MCP1167141.1 hypothetical protein [Limimaricola litoreus]